jgi:acetyl-CoA synthetase
MSERARTIDTLLGARRTFAPSPEFLAKARVKDQSLFEAAAADPEGFWADLGGGGYVTLTKPWPGMLRGLWGDDERYKETHRTRFGTQYFAGDGARIDEDGYFWFMGRVDDVMNVAGHRISTAEAESALVDHPAVAEAAVVAKPKWTAFTPDLPKTRSGKIMRRLLRDIAENRKLGDTTTLADSSIVADLQRRATQEEAKEQ